MKTKRPIRTTSTKLAKKASTREFKRGEGAKLARRSAITTSPAKMIPADPTAAPTDLGNEMFKDVVVRVRKLKGDGDIGWAERQYALGAEVKTVLDDLSAYGLKQGAKAVMLLAKETECQKDTIYNAVRVAGAWSQAEFERWLKKRTEKGNPITFAIFAEVAKLENPKAREAMLEDVRENDMSSRQVRAAVSVQRRKREAARKPKATSLARIVAASEKGLAAATNLAATIKLLGDEKGADTAKLARAAELQGELAAVCASNAKALRDLHEAADSAPPILIASNLAPKVPLLEAGAADQEAEPEEEDEFERSDVADAYDEMKGHHETHQGDEDEEGERSPSDDSLPESMLDLAGREP